MNTPTATLSRQEVTDMIQSGDIDFDKYRRLTAEAGLLATNEQIKDAIGQQTDDDDEEFVNILKTLIK